MHQLPKIHLSPQEILLVNNSEWILNKHIITKKVFKMFGELNEIFKTEAEPFYNLFPDNIKFQNGKISRGENYRLLPYVILDYPAFFWKDRIFAIRSMFWWGNFFSITLHLSGAFKEQFVTGKHDALSFLKKSNFFICVNEDEWQHHFQDDNYLPASIVNEDEFNKIVGKHFFKIAQKIPLDDWENATPFLLNGFREIMEFLQISYQDGKTDLSPEFPKVGSGL